MRGPRARGVRARAGAERGEPDFRSCAAEPAASGRRHARLRADHIPRLLEGARDLRAAHNRREREQRERDGREEDRARGRRPRGAGASATSDSSCARPLLHGGFAFGF